MKTLPLTAEELRQLRTVCHGVIELARQLDEREQEIDRLRAENARLKARERVS